MTTVATTRSKLEHCIERIVDNRGKTPPLSETGIELIEVNAIVSGAKSPVFENVRKHVSESTFASWFRSGHPKSGDTLISTVGAIGRVAFVKNERGCIAQNVIALRPKPNVLDGEFLYYYLSSKETQQRLLSLNIGVAQPSLKVPHLLSLDVEFPPLPAQRGITSILSAYDELIENCQRRIQILEQMARKLYREWFVQFRFPHHVNTPLVDSPLGKIPKGWSFGKLGDVCQVIPGYAFKSNDWQTTGVPVIKIKNIQPHNTVETEATDYVSEEISKRTNSKFVLGNGDILLAMTGATAGKIGRLRTKQPMLLNQRVAKLVPSHSYQEFVWYSVSTEEAMHRFFLLADGAAQPNMSGAQIEGINLLIPTGELAKQFSIVVNPILTQTDNFYIAIQNLRKTRDLLLPRLLSGQINVN